jgi:hypothetical protein
MIDAAENFEHKEIISAAFRSLENQLDGFSEGMMELRAEGIHTAGFIIAEVISLCDSKVTVVQTSTQNALQYDLSKVRCGYRQTTSSVHGINDKVSSNTHYDVRPLEDNGGGYTGSREDDSLASGSG